MTLDMAGKANAHVQLSLLNVLRDGRTLASSIQNHSPSCVQRPIRAEINIGRALRGVTRPARLRAAMAFKAAMRLLRAVLLRLFISSSFSFGGVMGRSRIR